MEHLADPVADHPEDMLPVLLTAAELATLRTVLGVVRDLEGSQASTAAQLLAAVDSREIGEPDYTYVLAGPWGTIREGDGSLEATIAGCRQARAQHWAEGSGRDDRYHQIEVERIATRYVYDEDGEPLGWFTSSAVVVPVLDEPLTDEAQAESDRRIADERADHEALYASLRTRRFFSRAELIRHGIGMDPEPGDRDHQD